MRQVSMTQLLLLLLLMTMCVCVLVTQKITDLLNTSNSSVKIREDRNVIG